LKPGAFKLWAGAFKLWVNWIRNVYSPFLEVGRVHDLDHAVLAAA
jgi:hypothetical protein